MQFATRSRFKLNRALSLPSILLLIVAVGMTVPCLSGQTEMPINGRIVAKDGRAIAGVTVYGSLSKTCCPFKRERTTTDDTGRFHLEAPGAVIHFAKDNLRPASFVISPNNSEVVITMEPASESLLLPVCRNPGSGQQRIGWGKYGLQYVVASREAKIFGGKPDVDYVRYVVRPKKDKVYLELWFGIYAMDIDPDDDLVVKSIKFSQRYVVDSEGRVVGLDSSGELADGTIWRQTSVLGNGGARYHHVDQKNAEFFNQTVNSACEVPYPQHMK